MATWKGKDYKFNLETYPPGCNGYGEWADVNYRWDYNTTSDILTVYQKEPHFDETHELYSQERAVAHMVTMMDWYLVFNGKEAFDKLISDLKKEHFNE